MLGVSLPEPSPMGALSCPGAAGSQRNPPGLCRQPRALQRGGSEPPRPGTSLGDVLRPPEPPMAGQDGALAPPSLPDPPGPFRHCGGGARSGGCPGGYRSRGGSGPRAAVPGLSPSPLLGQQHRPPAAQGTLCHPPPSAAGHGGKEAPRRANQEPRQCHHIYLPPRSRAPPSHQRSPGAHRTLSRFFRHTKPLRPGRSCCPRGCPRPLPQRSVTSSSAEVGWMATVLSRSALVAPILTATAKPCSISSQPSPCMCNPTTCGKGGGDRREPAPPKSGLNPGLGAGCQQVRADRAGTGTASCGPRHRPVPSTHLLLLASAHQLHDALHLPLGDGVVQGGEGRAVGLHVLPPVCGHGFI